MELNSVLTLTVTAAVVTYGMYLTITSVARSYFEARKINLKESSQEKILPLRLQAYERMCLFLERISPDHLVMRHLDSVGQAVELQQLLLREIREEFNHNLAQQIYIGADTWLVIRNAVGEVQALINQSAAAVDPGAPAGELGKQIIENVIRQHTAPTDPAIRILKEEVQALF